MPASRVLVGCAGWSVPRAERRRFPAEGPQLMRYAARLPAVEINSSFYREHRPETYARWSANVPAGFKFSVKMPQAITHERRLVAAGSVQRHQDIRKDVLHPRQKDVRPENH